MALKSVCDKAPVTFPVEWYLYRRGATCIGKKSRERRDGDVRENIVGGLQGARGQAG